MNEENRKGGCFKNLISIICIFIIGWVLFNGCSIDDFNIENSSTSNNQENIQSSEDNLYLSGQYKFANEKNIKLNTFSKNKGNINDYTSASEILLYVVEDNIFSGSRYKLTTNSSDFIYLGELKDNRPSGKGMLLKQSDVHYGMYEVDGMYYNILYIGEFSEGRYNGYGLEFNQPQGNDLNHFNHICHYDPQSEEYKSYYQLWLNYVKYEGEFKQSLWNGKGNRYEVDLSFRVDLENIIGKTDILTPVYDKITVGTFRKGKANGKCQIYVNGILTFSGKLKDDEMNGSGIMYYDSGQIEYKGHFKNDMRNGKGKLYNENGELIYNGNWENDDYK